jgi:autotransporter-associated beta strand protein
MSRKNRSQVTSAPQGVLGKLTVTCLSLASLSLVTPQIARADSGTWTGATSGQWANTANWSGITTTVPGTGNTATFNGASGNTTIDLDGGVTIGTLLFDTGSAAAYTIGSGVVGSQALTLDNAGAITINAGVTTNQLFNSNVQLSNAANASATITNNGSGTLTIAGTLSANAASGNGVLNVAGSGNITITGAVTEVGAGNSALKKVGSGTLTLSNGSTFNGTGASQPKGSGSGGNSAFTGPFFVQEGTLVMNGDTNPVNTVTGEAVIGGIAVNHGDPGQNAKLQVDAGALNISGFLSVGRGNGTGTATSDLELNNAATVTAGNFSAGFNGGSTLNTPKGTITLNGTSQLNITGNNFIAESAGSNFTVNVNDTALFRQTAAGSGETRVGMADNTVATINVNGGTASFERDAIVGYAGTSTGRLNLTSGTVNMASTLERWLMVGRDGASKGEITVNGGNLNLNTNSDIRFGRNSGASGTSFVTLNGGAITGWTGNASGAFSGTSVIDMNNSSTQATFSSTVNLNGGTLTIGQVISNNNAGTATFNFNGGTLRAAAASANFVDLGGASQTAVVKSGGAIIDSNSFNVTIPQALIDGAGGGGLTKNGTGTLTLSGANTYTGVTTVSTGTLALASTGSLTSTTLSVASTATFDVSAKSSYSLASNAITLSLDGSSIGLINAGALAVDFSGAALTLDLTTGTPGASYDYLTSTATGNLASVTLAGSFSGTLGRSGNIWTGTSSGYSFSLDQTSGALNITAVPEPHEFALAIVGLLGVMIFIRRRNQQA